jgi:hypothetical protein
MSKKSILYPVQFVLLLAVLFFNSCSGASTKSTDDANSQIDGLKIYAFHGTRQCTTCKNMKAYTKATLDKYFKNEMKSGKIEFKIIDVDDEANYAIAEKFEATGTALMINDVSNQKDNIEDWSDFAFEYAPGSQAEFERELKIRISQKLK